MIVKIRQHASRGALLPAVVSKVYMLKAVGDSTTVEQCRAREDNAFGG